MFIAYYDRCSQIQSSIPCSSATKGHWCGCLTLTATGSRWEWKGLWAIPLRDRPPTAGERADEGQSPASGQ
eukprot:8790688-Karenia_brevis.AAC.1